MRKESWWLALLFVALLGAMVLTPMLEQPPQRVATPAASGEFNELRAKARLAFILGDQRPHPADTDTGDSVRTRLVATLQQMGLKPVVRDQVACNELFKQRGVSCARVRNVIAELGPPTGKAILLNAHYDSTPVGPGAADDGIGVATLLEVGSILKERPLKRPVVLLFNEGEELGLVGARAFLADPLSGNVDSLINLEARGVRGPVNMFETSRPNAAPISLFAETVKHPVANSLSTDVYRLLPNYTDVNSFAERGWLTLNLAPIGNETRYHSPGDDVAALDVATLRHMGDQTLALTEALDNGAPKASGGDRIFMDIAATKLLALPLSLGIVLLVAVLLSLVVLAINRGGIARASAVVIGTVLGSSAVAWIALALIGAVRHGIFWRAEPAWTHLATYASAILVGAALLRPLARDLEVRQLRATFWLIYVAIGALIGLVAPGGIIFFLFPPLVALTGMIVARWWKPAEAVASTIALLFLYLTWGAMLGLLEELLNGGPMWLFAPLGSLLLLPVLIEAKPLIGRTGLRGTAMIAGALALVGWSVVLVAPAYSADRQQRFVIQHVTDASANKSWWSVLNDGAPLPYAGQWKRGELPFSDRPRWLSFAPADPAAKAPDVDVLSQVQSGDERTLSVRLKTNGNEQVSLIAPADARLRAAGVDGFVRPVGQSTLGKYFVSCFGRSCDGMILQLRIGQLKPVEFTVLGSKSPLPASATPLLAARPRFARPQYNRDEEIAFVTRKL
jgi:hypothetical protein